MRTAGGLWRVLASRQTTLTILIVVVPVRWKTVLETALDNNQVISVAGVVRAHLDREATRSELSAARRAAHGLVNSGDAVAVLVQLPGAHQGEDRLLLVWPGTDTCDPEVLLELAANSALPRVLQKSRTATLNDVQAVLRTADANAIAVGEIDIQQLTPLDAHDYAARLEDANRRLHRFHARLVRRGREAS